MEKFENKLVEVNRLIKQGNFASSLNYLSELHEIDSDNEEINFLTAHSHFSLNNFTASLLSLTKLLDYNNEHLAGLKLQFKIYHQQEKLFDAYKVIKKIIALEQKLENQYELAIICTRIGKVAEAKDELEAYTQKVFDNAFAYLNLGHMHKAFGDFDLAEVCYYKFAELEPTSLGFAIWNIADLKDRKVTEKELTSWQLMEKDSKQSYVSKTLIQFSLGTVLEKQARYAESFDFFLKANANKDKISPFNKSAFNKFINNILSINDNKIKPLDKTITPIFIVGLPRSGSTLVEQILSSHDLVNATDELNFIGYTAANMERTGSYAKAISDLDESKMQELRQEYLDYAGEYQTTKTPYFIDKNPLNFFHIGLILKLFPEAKIIHTHRNLLDNAVSLFKRYFYIGHDYSYSIPNIITFMKGYSQVMQHWERLFPNKIYHSQYELLVKNPTSQIESILSYCDLEKQKECFTFYKQKKVVLTPSVDQVNKPINSSSINSWQRYEEQMSPFKAELMKINDTLLLLGCDNEKPLRSENKKSAWDNYWELGYITSFGSKFEKNYVGIIEKVWTDFFSNITAESKILDLATGNGAVLKLALNQMSDGCETELVGIDYSQIRSTSTRIKLMSGVNVEALPFKSGSFTHVTSQFGIEYSDFKKSLPEVAQVLKKSGRFQFICHHSSSVILSDNRNAFHCTSDLLKFGGAIYLLDEMLVELNNKQIIGTMNEKVADDRRNKLNNELSRLLKEYGDAVHDTFFPQLLRTVLQKNISISERNIILQDYIYQQKNALIRLEDLINVALDETDLIAFKKIAKNYGLSCITCEELIEPGVGLIGMLIEGEKL